MVLQEKSTTIGEERNSRKSPLTQDEAVELLAQVETVRIGKGRKIVEQPASETSPEDLKGRSGNFRAPMVRRGKTLLVGFNAEALAALL